MFPIRSRLNSAGSGVLRAVWAGIWGQDVAEIRSQMKARIMFIFLCRRIVRGMGCGKVLGGCVNSSVTSFDWTRLVSRLPEGVQVESDEIFFLEHDASPVLQRFI